MIDSNSAGKIGQNSPKRQTLSGTFTPATSGYYTIFIDNWRNLAMTDCYNYIDDVTVEPATPDLTVDNGNIDIDTGRLVMMTLDAGASNAGKKYLLLASWGTYPGLTIDGIHVPLEYDWLFTYTQHNFNNNMFQNTFGTLNSSGKAIARFMTIGPLNPSLLGRNMFFAYVLLTGSGRPITYASFPVMCTFVP